MSEWKLHYEIALEEIKSLRAELEAAHRANLAGLNELEAEVAALRKDAKRYEWVRTHPVLTQNYIVDEFAKLGPFDLLDPVAIDRVIDAAQADKQEPV